MKLSFFFDTKAEILDARISICTNLIERGLSKKELVAEVKDLTRGQVIRKAVKHVDQSRINSDLGGYTDNRSRIYRTMFDRYVELNKNDYSSYKDEMSLMELSASLPKDLLKLAAHMLYVLDVNLNEKNVTYTKLLKMLRDEFTFGTNGLNS